MVMSTKKARLGIEKIKKIHVSRSKIKKNSGPVSFLIIFFYFASPVSFCTLQYLYLESTVPLSTQYPQPSSLPPIPTLYYRRTTFLDRLNNYMSRQCTPWYLTMSYVRYHRPVQVPPPPVPPPPSLLRPVFGHRVH